MRLRIERLANRGQRQWFELGQRSTLQSLFRGAAILVFVLSVVTSPTVLSQTPQVPLSLSAEDILRVHRADRWPSPPNSVRITGRSTRNGKTENVTITATRQEEIAVEYETTKQVGTTKKFFTDDGTKNVYASTPPGFSQLDITGLFLISELRFRSAQFSSPRIATFLGKTYYSVRVSNASRTQTHYAHLKVLDELDVYLDGAGVLSGISRTFYQQLPRFTVTQAYRFSDYRETNEVWLPYRIEKFINGKQVENIEIASYAFDVLPSPTLFEPRRISR